MKIVLFQQNNIIFGFCIYRKSICFQYECNIHDDITVKHVYYIVLEECLRYIVDKKHRCNNNDEYNYDDNKLNIIFKTTNTTITNEIIMELHEKKDKLRTKRFNGIYKNVITCINMLHEIYTITYDNK